MPTKSIQEMVAPIAREYGVRKISLFGSRARGEASGESDYDFLITRGNIDTLLKYVAFVNRLEEAFGTHVDVVTDTAEDQDFIESIQKEAILLYEQS